MDVILVDYRAGSTELTKPLKELGLPAEETTLDFGDVAFTGRGEKGVSLDIGIEFKKIEELITSLRTGRFTGYQLPGMRKSYDHSWLLIEGLWQPDKRGQICLRRGKSWRPVAGKMTAMELEKQLLTLQFNGGINVRFTATRSDTLRVLCSLFRWWTDANLDDHRSHLSIYHPPTLVPVSVFRQVLSGLPDVGFKVSLAAELRFKTIKRAVMASVQDWADLTTIDKKGNSRKLGMTAAQRVVTAIGGL